MREYCLHVRKRGFSGPPQAQRIVPSRPSKNLRRGGGRRAAVGWSKQTIRTNKRRLDELARWFQSAITVKPPRHSNSEQLTKLNKSLSNWFKQRGIPARCVWEGPAPHCHIALGIASELREMNRFNTSLRRAWRRIFGENLPPDAVLWKSVESGERLANYLGKTYKDRRYPVKARYEWHSFSPVWECHFRALSGRKKSASPEAVKPLVINGISTQSAGPVYRMEKECETKGADTARKTVAGFGGLASPWMACLLPL